jgi:hypothetical protein
VSNCSLLITGANVIGKVLALGEKIQARIAYKRGKNHSETQKKFSSILIKFEIIKHIRGCTMRFLRYFVLFVLAVLFVTDIQASE